MVDYGKTFRTAKTHKGIRAREFRKTPTRSKTDKVSTEGGGCSENKHPGGGQGPATSLLLPPTSREDMLLDGYLEYPHVARALFKHLQTCLHRDSNQSPTVQQSISFKSRLSFGQKCFSRDSLGGGTLAVISIFFVFQLFVRKRKSGPGDRHFRNVVYCPGVSEDSSVEGLMYAKATDATIWYRVLGSVVRSQVSSSLLLLLKFEGPLQIALVLL
ncbi:hypothetical protein TNCV_258201 [Trichonephila clavipes]|uniref:Uncharacterized protein n=1 Tax=Trichonephila clavipes TaxID=2585209 RepID=A0A8X6V0D9_TRICX|nr:hypothetical protein TNCV_258201 [Trichonephila clavipes]